MCNVFKKLPHSRTAGTNCLARHKMLCKIQPLKLVAEEILAWWCEHYLICWWEDMYRATHSTFDYTQLLQQRRKALLQNPFAHQHSVTVSDSVKRQVKIGLHQFGNCLSQVKIDVTTVTAVSCYSQGIRRVLHFPAGQFPGTHSMQDNQLSCL